MAIDGFYRFVYGGQAGSGLGLLALQNGKITGVDGGGGEYDGHYEEDRETGNVAIHVDLLVPANMPLVVGAAARPDPWTLHIDAKLPPKFAGGIPVTIPTPFAPVNVSFKLLKKL
jgi:hypothetical protein